MVPVFFRLFEQAFDDRLMAGAIQRLQKVIEDLLARPGTGVISPALSEGGFQVLLVEEDALAYLRDTGECRVILVGNRGAQDRPAGDLRVAHGAIPNGLVFRELFSGQTSVVRNGYLPLPPVQPGAQIWQSQAE